MTDLEFDKVAVIGAGTMGAGIAGLFAAAGCEVTLVDVSDEKIAAGVDLLKQSYAALENAGRLTREEAEAGLGRVHATMRLEDACDGTGLLVEAVSEDLELKKELFGRFDRHCPDHALLATNTSGLSITEIASAATRSDKVAGMHFWNPPHVIPLVEVTQGKNTSQDTSDRIVAVCRALGKRPILVQHDVPGFVGNRLQFAVVREALHLLSEGVASAEDIDAAMTAGPGLRYGLIGPLQTADLGGLDVFLSISRHLFGELYSGSYPPPRLEELVREEKLGVKSGEGFYRYSAQEVRQILARRDKVLFAFQDALEKQD